MMNITLQDKKILGIGFGPAQLAVAYALSDIGLANESVFLEAQDRFAWHPGMLLPGTTMQVNFTKDLVTPRQPTHSASFLNYLHEHKQLASFTNLKTLFPSRAEFAQYLKWAADRVPCDVRFGRRVERVCWDDERQVFVVSAGDEKWHASNIVAGLGLTPVFPRGVASAERIWHSENFLPQLAATDERTLRRVLVVGSGQSAAEIVRYLLQNFAETVVTSVVRSYGFAPADDSPFVNRVFDPEGVDDFFHSEAAARERVLREHRNTNYSVVDGELIDELARVDHEQRYAPTPRFVARNLTSIEAAQQIGSSVEVRVRELRSGTESLERFDAVVFATGYEQTPIGALFDNPGEVFELDESGMPQTTRQHRARLHGAISGSIWLHGHDEATHGLSSSLLSNIAVRGGEIASELSNALGRTQSSTLAQPVTVTL